MQNRLAFAVVFLTLLAVAGCYRWDCDKKAHPYASLNFEVVDKNTGLPLYTVPGTLDVSVPDSIQLKNVSTQQVYDLHASSYNGLTMFSVTDYKGVTGTVDRLELRFGMATTDTLEVAIGSIKGWRGDECGWVSDPGVTNVIHKGDTIYAYQTSADSTFVLKK